MDDEATSTPNHYINRIVRVGNRWTEPRLHRLGLAVAQVPVFSVLKSLGPLPQKGLARLLQVEQPTMAQLLSRMEREGLIQRHSDEHDGRSSLIALTQKALRKVEPAREVLRKGNHVALQGFTSHETATLKRLLKRVLQNLEEALESDRKEG